MESVCIFSTDDLAEAESVKSLLEENDIQPMLKNVYTQNIFGGLKPFSGYDPIAGSIQIYILENQVDKAMKLLGNEDEEVSNNKKDTILEIDNIKYEAKAINNKLDINRTIFFSYLLSSMSFLIIPYFINIPFLIKLKKSKKTLFYMLFIQSTIFILGSIIFIIIA